MTLLSVLAAVGSNWRGTALTCHFSATADGVPLAVADDTKPVWVIPTTAATLSITATPTVPTYWPTTVNFSIDSNSGALTATGDTTAFVTVHALGAAGVQLSLASINLSRFKDVSDDVLALLANPPPMPSPDMFNKTRQQFYEERYGAPPAWPPPDWGLDDKPNANFLDLPVLAQGVTSQGVTFSNDPSVQVEAQNVVLRLAGVVAPKLWGVSWPTSLDRNEDAGPTPIMLFLRQGNWPQYANLFEGAGLPPYPDNFDYASFGLYDNLAYPKNDVLEDPDSKGVPYQVAKGGAKAGVRPGADPGTKPGARAVTVLPVNSLHEDYGVIESTKQMGRILLELQSFMFRKAGVATPPETLGDTAIGSFSSGTHILARILASPDNVGEAFLNDTVRAVYFFDTPGWAIGDCVAASLAWAGAAGRDKRVRFYNQDSQPGDGDLWPALKTFAKHLPAPLPKEPFIANSTDKRLTLGFVSRASWKALIKQAAGVQLTGDVWAYVHHATAATMLSHALSTDDLR